MALTELLDEMRQQAIRQHEEESRLLESIAELSDCKTVEKAKDVLGSSFEDFENVLPYHVGYSGGRWNNEDGEQVSFEVIAWQPVPEPYKTEE